MCSVLFSLFVSSPEKRGGTLKRSKCVCRTGARRVYVAEKEGCMSIAMSTAFKELSVNKRGAVTPLVFCKVCTRRLRMQVRFIEKFFSMGQVCVWYRVRLTQLAYFFLYGMSVLVHCGAKGNVRQLVERS